MSEAESLIVILIVGTSVTLFLAGSIIFFVVFYQKRMLQKKMELQNLEADYQRQLLQSTIDSQEKERKRIAADLHDGVGAMLSATKLNLNMLKSGAIPQEEQPEALEETKEIIDETIETVRRISKDLMPTALESFGLAKALQELCEKLSNKHLSINFVETGKEPELDQAHQLLLYRIVQELVNNAIKHAEADEIQLIIDWHEPLQIIVEDNGKGFDLSEVKQDIKRGVGLYSIENRVSLIKGKVEINTNPGQGTSIKIKTDAELA